MRNKIVPIVAVTLIVTLFLVQINVFHGKSAVAQTGTSVNSIGVPASQFSQTNQNGMNINAAEATYTSGNSNVLIAYIEGGINLHNAAFVKSIDSSLYINWHETPVPCSGSTLATATMVIGGVTKPCSLYYSNNISDYEINGQTSVNALDWANDPRVKDVNGNGIIDPEDVLVAFSNNVNNDHSGYPNDIFGWDFYDNQNDPATQDAAYEHSDDQMGVIHSLCPKCMIMPIRAGDEALDTSTNLAQSWVYACSQGANIIVSVTADLGYTPAMANAINYCNSKGVIMVESSNDFDSIDHQGGMYWPYVIPGNGLVSNVEGLPSSYTNTIPNRHWTRSNLTSWGPHAMFSVPTYGGSTSESTPTTGAVLGLLLSEGMNAYALHQIPAPLTGQQAIQLMRETATPITDPTLSWPGAPGSWNPQYGYGMPNIDAAMNLIATGDIPPTVQINSPDWYSIEDPTTTATVPVTATIDYNQPYTYTLYYGLGADPTSWTQISTGSRSSDFSGVVGTLNTSQIPSSFYSQPMSISTNKELSTADQYDLTFKIKVVANSNSSLTGVDRRVVYAIHDPSWLNGAPEKFSSSIESQPALVDLQGSGHLDMVFATSGGQINAIDPATGKELPGWPQYTDPLQTIGNSGVNFGDEEVLQSVAVGDLYHTGQLDVIVTSLSGHVYAYNAYGKLLPGWPVSVDTGATLVPPTPIPRPSNPYTRSPISGFLAAPVLADLSGNGQLDVIQAGLDGRIYIWQPNGTLLPNWPVQVSLPSNFKLKSGYSLINDPRLISAPTVAYFNGHSNPPSIVVRTQYTEIQGPGISVLPFSISMAYSMQGQLLSGWPVVLQGLAEYYGSAMDAITEGTNNPIAVPTSNGNDQVIIEPLWTPPYVINGNGITQGYLGNPIGAAQSLLDVYNNPLLTLNPSSLPTDNPIPFAGYGAVGDINGALTYASSEMGAASFAASETVASSGIAINNYVDTYPLSAVSISNTTMSPSPFQAVRQGADFLSGPIIGDVMGNSQNDVIVGGDSNTLVAYQPNGQIVPGFPKFTTGWVINSPSMGDLLSTGTNDIVAGTREGYLFIWKTDGSASSNNQWWKSNANEWNQNRYGVVTRPPGVVQSITQSGTQLSFIAPGSTWYNGQASYYQLTYEPSGQVIDATATVSAGNTQTINFIPGQTSVTIQAVNAAGLLATPETYTFATSSNSNTNTTSNSTAGSTTNSQVSNQQNVTSPSPVLSTVNLQGNTGKGFLSQIISAISLMTVALLLLVKLRNKKIRAKLVRSKKN
jgi:hypothetical protein